MTPRRVVALAIVALVLLPSMPWTPRAGAEPLRAFTVHVQAFSDGNEEVTGLVSSSGPLVLELEVPAGAEVQNASLVVERLRYQVTEHSLDAAPRALWCGDADRDGVQDDLFVALPEAGRVELYSMEGDPTTLVWKQGWEVPDPTALTLDDLDRDQDRDLLVTSGSQGRLYVFECLSPLEFADPVVVPLGPRPVAVLARDLDPDFKRDVVVANGGGSSVSMLRGRGDMDFYGRIVEMGRGPSAVQMVDVDKDTDLDMVVAESRNGTVRIMYNEGNGNFTNSTVLPAGEAPQDVDARDVNGDSLVDIVVACSVEDQVWVYVQMEDGNYTLDEVLPTGAVPRAVRGLQLNRAQDTNTDLAVVCSGSDSLALWLAGGDLRHTIPVEVEVGGRPVALGTIRENGEREDTLVVACQMPPSIALVTPVEVADVIHVGLGQGGREGRTSIEPGTEAALLDLTPALGTYVRVHHGSASAGVLRVPLVVSADREGWLRVSDLSVWCRPNLPPRADAGPTVSVLVGETAQLNASASYDPENGTLSFQWLVPIEGAPVLTDRISQFVFDEPGTFHVFLVVLDPWGLQDHASLEVRVNAPPLARGSVPDSTRAREPTRLSAHLSEDPDGSIVDYIWDYGLGVVHGRSVDVLFTGEGTRNVTLEVVDDQGARSVAFYQIRVLASEEPLREPAERVPDDEGALPGPGALAMVLALLAGAVILRRRRR